MHKKIFEKKTRQHHKEKTVHKKKNFTHFVYFFNSFAPKGKEEKYSQEIGG